ncbi:MAG: glycosyl hydrolase family protein, partial [Acidobacteriaceae bacterium]
PSTAENTTTNTKTKPQSIRNLRGFLDMVNWRAIYGLNLGKGTITQAADEAAFVAKTLGDRLICFQIGNEADLYCHNGLRPKTYAYADFARDWRKIHDAVKARVPGARFAGPDTAGTGSWVEEFAQQFGSDVMLLSTHYYAEGPARDSSMNIERLLRPNPKWEDAVAKIRRAMEESKLPYRLTETNSCYGGGKAGVSNTFASSLWALDLMLQLCAAGGSGINFHGGGYGWYAPIVGTPENGFVARPEYYAMLVASRLAGSRIIGSHLDVTDANPLFVAYAFKDAQEKVKTVILNKDAGKNLRLTIAGRAQRVSVQRLISPRLDDEQDTTFGGASVGGDGAWKATHVEHAHTANGSAECLIPAGSAALFELD